MRGLRGTRGMRGMADAGGGVYTPPDIVEVQPDAVTGLWTWLRSDSGVTLNGGNVSSWADSAALHGPFVQATAGSQPLLVANEHGALMDVIRFDGTDDYLSLASIPATGVNPVTVIVAVRNVTPHVADQYDHVVHYGQANNGMAYSITARSYTPHTGAGNDGPGNHFWASGVAGADACPTHAVLVASYDGTTARIRVNKVETANKAVTLNVGGSVFNIGSRLTAGEYFMGDLCEVVIYTAVPSDTDLQGVELYLYNRWVA